jgi:hypothetical protein
MMLNVILYSKMVCSDFDISVDLLQYVISMNQKALATPDILSLIVNKQRDPQNLILQLLNTDNDDFVRSIATVLENRETFSKISSCDIITAYMLFRLYKYGSRRLHEHILNYMDSKNLSYRMHFVYWITRSGTEFPVSSSYTAISRQVETLLRKSSFICDVSSYSRKYTSKDSEILDFIRDLPGHPEFFSDQDVRIKWNKSQGESGVVFVFGIYMFKDNQFEQLPVQLTQESRDFLSESIKCVDDDRQRHVLPYNSVVCGEYIYILTHKGLLMIDRSSSARQIVLYIDNFRRYDRSLVFDADKFYRLKIVFVDGKAVWSLLERTISYDETSNNDRKLSLPDGLTNNYLDFHTMSFIWKDYMFFVTPTYTKRGNMSIISVLKFKETPLCLIRNVITDYFPRLDDGVFYNITPQCVVYLASDFNRSRFGEFNQCVVMSITECEETIIIRRQHHIEKLFSDEKTHRLLVKCSEGVITNMYFYDWIDMKFKDQICDEPLPLGQMRFS